MSMSITCPCCGKQFSSLEPQAGSAISCASCAGKVCVFEEGGGASARPSANWGIDVRSGEAVDAALTKLPVETVEAEEESFGEEVLELGPRWRQVESAFAWLRFGVAALMLGLVCHLVAVLLPSPFTLLATLVQNLAFAAAGFSLFAGQLFCLRIPAGTRARSLAAFCLATRILAYGLRIYGASYCWDAEATSIPYIVKELVAKWHIGNADEWVPHPPVGNNKD